ncbi:MAG: FkbM family methyltransferase [Rhabdochlamydiaceae bacterium]|nr:FkbM family methyltransferase [Rhabdochlamydiaceae bacterium]
MKFAVLFTCIFLSMISCGHADSQFKKKKKPAAVSASIQQIGKLNFNSQASQDEFVYTLLYPILGKQDAGYYLEIGAGEPTYINNSYFFESNLGWNGVSIDILDVLRGPWNSTRRNPLLIEDATQADYASILRSFPQVIDYLSLDIDGYYDTVLKQIPFDDHIFKIITIEHDAYRYGDVFREKERTFLTALGYHLLCPNVSLSGFVFEDWWIHPSVFPPSVFSELSSLNLDGKDNKQVIQIIQSAMCN